MIIFSLLIFFTITLGIVGTVLWLQPSRTEQRLQSLAGLGPLSHESDWQQTLVRIAGPFAKLSVPEGDWDTSALRLQFLRAGVRHPDARIAYFATKTLLPLLTASLAYIGMRALNQSHGFLLAGYVMACALVGCYLPNLVLWLAGRARHREILENFPDAADLMLVCVEAGLGLDAALTKVAEDLRRNCLPLAEELHLTNLEMRAGATREQSLRNLQMRTGVAEIGTFATMLTQADKFGTSIGDSLRVFSDDLRHRRYSRAEEAAAKVPTKMLFPLVIFIFPSIIMVILGPALIQIIRTITPILGIRG
jgi:tight adherence protein C